MIMLFQAKPVSTNETGHYNTGDPAAEFKRSAAPAHPATA
jgi:hypothetical protein